MTQRELSRKEWMGDNTVEKIDSGSLQRIADACEKMCWDREKLERDKAFALKDAVRWREWYKAERRRNAALRGQITKLRKRLVGG